MIRSAEIDLPDTQRVVLTGIGLPRPTAIPMAIFAKVYWLAEVAFRNTRFAISARRWLAFAIST